MRPLPTAEGLNYPDGLGEYKEYKNGTLVNDAILQSTANPVPSLGEFGLLAPSIMNMGVDELNGQLIITGLFGCYPELGRTTTVGGVPAPIVSSDFGIITTDLAATGDGSAGGGSTRP